MTPLAIIILFRLESLGCGASRLRPGTLQWTNTGVSELGGSSFFLATVTAWSHSLQCKPDESDKGSRSATVSTGPTEVGG